MAVRLLILLLCAMGLTACLSDVADEPAASPSAATSATPESAPPRAVAGASSQSAATTAPDAMVTSTATPRAFVTPFPASTSGPGDPATVRLDEACLSGELASPLSDAKATAAPGGEQEEFPGPFEPSPFVEDLTLQAELDGLLGSQADSYAYYVKDLRTGRGAVHNGSQVFNAASLFKLFVMYEVFHQQSMGLLHWDDELVVTPYYDGFALSPRTTELCQVLTVGEAMDAMLSVSDNAAAVLLQDLVHSGNVNAAIAALGLTDSGLFEDGLPVTADDLALLMEAIAEGQAVNALVSARMVGLLDHDVFRNGLVDGVPEGTLVARKTGNWSDATNVAGIVYAPSGPYVFVALTSNGYETSVIQALSAATYARFAGTAEPVGP